MSASSNAVVNGNGGVSADMVTPGRTVKSQSGAVSPLIEDVDFNVASAGVPRSVTIGGTISDSEASLGCARSDKQDFRSVKISSRAVSASDETIVTSSHVGSIEDDYDSEAEISETNFDVDYFDENPEDLPPGLAEYSSEEELSDDDEDSEEMRVIDKVKFIGWRMDGWASLQVGDRSRGRGKRRKIRAHDLSDLMRRRGPLATGSASRRDVQGVEHEEVGEETSAESLSLTGQLDEKEVKEDDFAEGCENNTNTTAQKPYSIEIAAIEVMAAINLRLADELRAREAARSTSVTTFGSTGSWLNGTDDGSRAGRDYDQDAQGNPSQPKPTVIPLGGTRRAISTLIPVKKVSAISSIGPEEWIEIEVTVDSGACETVMPAGLCTGIPILRSSCSHGAEYEVANGETIPNQGERRCHMMTLGSTTAKSIVFQVADVHKPLLSISRCADMGFHCHLGEEGGYMEDQVTGEKIPLHRRDNLYHMKTWIRADPSTSHMAQAPPSEPTFVGQGR